MAWLILQSFKFKILLASATLSKLSIYSPLREYLFNFPFNLDTLTLKFSSFSRLIKYPFILFYNLIALVKFPLSVSKNSIHSLLVADFTNSPDSV